MTKCALLECDQTKPAEIGVYVFGPGMSYPLNVCSYDHYVWLTYAAPYGIDVVLTKQGRYELLFGGADFSWEVS